jgi:hypothetical protein
MLGWTILLEMLEQTLAYPKRQEKHINVTHFEEICSSCPFKQSKVFMVEINIIIIANTNHSNI